MKSSLETARGQQPAVMVRNVRHWLDEWEQLAEIIVGSVRAVSDIRNVALAGAHIVIVPPQFLPKMVDHKYRRETVRQFHRDVEKAMVQIAEARFGSHAGNGA